MIKFYYGTVGAGKSMHLINSYLNAKRLNPEKRVWLMKPETDTRTKNVFTRFGNVEAIPDMLVGPNPMPNFLDADILFVDEAQFIPTWLIDFAKDFKGREWHFYGLRNDSNKKMWSSIIHLMTYADEIIELPSICEICRKNKASFNKALRADLDPQHAPGFDFIGVCGGCY